MEEKRKKNLYSRTLLIGSIFDSSPPHDVTWEDPDEWKFRS